MKLPPSLTSHVTPCFQSGDVRAALLSGAPEDAAVRAGPAGGGPALAARQAARLLIGRPRQLSPCDWPAASPLAP